MTRCVLLGRPVTRQRVGWRGRCVGMTLSNRYNTLYVDRVVQDLVTMS